MITLSNTFRILKQKKTLITILCMTLLSITLKDKDLSNNMLRLLFNEYQYYELCNHTESSLLVKYTYYYDSPIPIVEPDEYQRAIIKLMNDTSFSNYMEYLPRIKFYIISLILLFVFISLWVIYSYWRYCPAKFFKKTVPKIMYHKKTYLTITIITVICVLALSIISIILISPLIEHLNGSGCSVFKVVRHSIYGTEDDYPENGYHGIGEIRDEIQLLIDIRTKFSAYDEYLSKGVEMCDKYRDTFLFKSACKIIDNANNASTLVNLNLEEEIENLQNFIDLCNDVEDEYLDYVYLYVHDYADFYINLLGIIIFSLTLSLSFLSIVFILLYKYVNAFKKYAKIIYDVIWNMAIFTTILTLIISVIMGSVSAIGNDVAVISQYFVSEKNLKSGNESVIINCEKYAGACYCLNKCLNGNGRILIPENLNVSELEQKKDEIEDGVNNKTSGLEELFDKFGDSKIKDVLYNATNSALEVYTLFNDVADTDKDFCLFLKSDFEILVDEVDDIGDKAYVVSVSSYCVLCFMTLSTLFGILAAFDFKKETISDKDVSEESKKLDLNIEMCCMNESNDENNS